MACAAALALGIFLGRLIAPLIDFMLSVQELLLFLLLQVVGLIDLCHYLIDQMARLLKLRGEFGRFLALHLTQDLEVDQMGPCLLQLLPYLVKGLTEVIIGETLSLSILLLLRIVQAPSKLFYRFIIAFYSEQFQAALEA